MLEIDVPSRGVLRLERLVLDVNGALALDGQLVPAAYERLAKLSEKLDLWLVSADTQGTLVELADVLQIKWRLLQKGNEATQKAALVGELGAERVVALGNGANDAMMLRQAALGTLALAGSARVAVLGGEGLSAACLAARDIESALDLLLYPRRLVATLRT
jgi:P-type E1-E2 ATPase